MTTNDMFDLGRTGKTAPRPGDADRAVLLEKTQKLRAENALRAEKLRLSRVAPGHAGQELLADLPEILGEREIVLNFETTGLRWWSGDLPVGMSFHFPQSGRKGYVPLRHEVGNNVDIAAYRRWANSFENIQIKNINTKFDLHMAEADEIGWRDRPNVTFADVSHEAALLDDYRIHFNLDQLSEDILGWDAKSDGLGKIPDCIDSEVKFRYLHPGVVAPYAIRNVDQVLALDRHFQTQIIADGLLDVQALERETLPAVVEMEKNGLYLDVPQLERWHKEVAERIQAIKFKIYRATGLELTSFDSSKQASELFAKRGLKSTMKTEGGDASFAAGVLKEFIADPVIADFYEGGQLADLHSKYLDKYLKTVDSNGWIRFNLNQLRSTKDGGGRQGAVSGRFSAAGDRQGGFNPQQVVSAEKQLERGWCPNYVVRRLFKAAPGYRYVIASDMMQVEYRLFAHYARMHQAFHDAPLQKMIGGKPVWIRGPLADFHALVAELLQPINPMLNRKLVKNVNFASIYGAGLLKFTFMIGLITQSQYDHHIRIFNGRASVRDLLNSPKSEIKDEIRKGLEVRQVYDEMFPAVRPLLQETSKLAETRGYVKTVMGRRARLVTRFHSALNRIIQGGAADVNKRALVEVYKRRKELGFHMQVTVHDEIMGSGNDGVAPALDKELNTQYFDLRVPILWDTKQGDTWAACK